MGGSRLTNIIYIKIIDHLFPLEACERIKDSQTSCYFTWNWIMYNHFCNRKGPTSLNVHHDSQKEGFSGVPTILNTSKNTSPSIFLALDLEKHPRHPANSRPLPWATWPTNSCCAWHPRCQIQQRSFDPDIPWNPGWLKGILIMTYMML